MIFENFKLAYKAFTGNRLRTFLSILGIVIGVGSVITITTLGQSATNNITESISEAGLETISIFPRSQTSEVRRKFTLELADDIKNDIEGIEYAVPVDQGDFMIKYGSETYDTRAMAVTEVYDDIFSYELSYGSFISENDNEGRKKVVVLGHEAAETLFPDGDAVGKYLRLYRNQAISFKVIGVMQSRSDSIGVSFDSSVYIPYNTFAQRIQKSDSVGSYTIGTEGGVDVLRVSEDIENYLLNVIGDEDSYKVISPTTIAEMYTGITATLNMFLSGIAAISLLVGGIGIMNIMLVSVAERTKEIGIRKALGASPSVIQGQFLTEAVTLTTFGGAIGMILGALISYIATVILKWGFYPNLFAFVLAFFFSSIVGVFFGFYPAVKAAKLNPVDALAFE